MVVKILFLLLVGSYCALSDENVTLELNSLDNPTAYTSELNFSNSRVFTHDVNPRFKVERVTQNGLTVWKSPKTLHKVTNATLVFNDLGPRFIYLAVHTGDGQTQLLYYLYTLNGWVNFNNINPYNILLDNSDTENKLLSPSNDKENNLDDGNKNKDENDLEPADLDIQMGPYDKFDYKFTFKESRYTYYFKPRKGYFVRTVNEGKTVLWKVRPGQVLAFVNCEKINGHFLTASVTYLQDNVIYVDLFTNGNSGWEFKSTSESVPPVNQVPVEKEQMMDSHELSEAMKPVGRLTVFDISNIPEPPKCRKCTYALNGIVYNVVYPNSNSNVRSVVDGSTLIYDVPPELKFDHACIYSKNDKIIFVDFMVREPDKSIFVYFEKVDAKYKMVPRAEFKEKLNKMMEFPAVIDISDQKDGYNVVTHIKDNVEYNVFTPADGYVVKRVVDGNQFVIVYETDVKILQVTVHYFKQEKSLLSVFYQSGSTFSYEYFTYFKELTKWVRIPDHFYFKLINEYVDEEPHKLPSLDITSSKPNKKYFYTQEFKHMGSKVFIIKPGVLLSSVLDAGRMVWTSRYPNEYCVYVWHQLQHNLLYVISKDSSNVRSYRYEKSNDKWYVLNEDEFKLRFSFIFSKNLVADMRDDLDEQYFDIKENDNLFIIKPKSGYLINKIRYGNRVIWIGSDKLKCTTLNVIFGWHDTYLYLELLDSEYRSHVKYYKTINGDIFKWRSCKSFFDDCECNESSCLSNRDLNKGNFGFDVKKYLTDNNTTDENTEIDKQEDNVDVGVVEKEFKEVKNSELDKNTTEEKLQDKDKEGKETQEKRKENERDNKDDKNKEENRRNSPTKRKYGELEEDEEGEFLVNDGDHLVVTKVDGSKNQQPSFTNLSTDTTQVINGITVKPNSTLHFTPGVFDESQMAVTDYLTGNKKPLESIGFERRLPITLEPHNPEKVSEFEQNQLNGQFEDAEKDYSVENSVKNLYKLKESSENSLEKAEKGKTLTTEKVTEKKVDKTKSEDKLGKTGKTDSTMFNSSVPRVLVYPKHTDPTGKSNTLNKGKKTTSTRELQKLDNSSNNGKPKLNALPSTLFSVPGSNTPKKVDSVYENKTNATLTTPDDFIHPDDPKSGSSELSKSEQKSESKSLTTPEDFDLNVNSNYVRNDFKESDNKGEKSSPSQALVEQTKSTKEKQFVGFGQFKKSYVNGLLYLQDIRTSEFGEFRDARPFGFNYLLFTPKPGLPIKELRDGFETIWVSDTKECLAFSVFLKNGFPYMLELFVKCSLDVRRKYYELVDDKWREVSSQRYDSVTN